MTAFREPTAEEVRLATIQFIGQNLGALKDLDSRVIDKNPTLQGLTMNPVEVVKSIPVPRQSVQISVPRQQSQPSAYVQPAATIYQQPNNNIIEQSANITYQQPGVDSNQLEFDFDNSATAQKIYNIVDKLLVKVESLENKLDKILSNQDS